MMKTPSDVYKEYAARRQAVIRALTTDVDSLYGQCDPEKENLCLYGYPDGTWTVDVPAEEVPPEAPEPALGINFARDGMQKKDWLALVAVHSDSWLMSLAFYKAARFSADQRQELFDSINQLPTCYEVVSGKVRNVVAAPAPSRKRPYQDDLQQEQQQQQQHHHHHHHQHIQQQQMQQLQQIQQMQQHTLSRYPKPNYAEPDDDADLDDGGAGAGGDYGGGEEGEGDPCPSCGRYYQTDEFWIACDFCDTWYCGRCSKMTAAKAEKYKKWKCPNCMQRSGG